MTCALSRRNLTLALGAAALLPATRARAAEVTLRFASINLANTAAFQQILVPFAQAVEKDSAGRIEVDLKPMGGFGKPADLFNMTERGDIDICATVQGYNPGRFPRSSVMELPLMFDSAVAGTHALWKLFQDGDIAADYATVKVLGLYMLPPYGIFTNGKKIVQLKDLRGLRVRTPSPTVGLALSRLGAIPVGVPTDLIGDMLESRIINAITYGWDSLTTGKGFGDKKLADQVDVLVDANFAAPALMVVMNRASWDALPPDLQMIVEGASGNLSIGNARLRDTLEAKAIAVLKTSPNHTYVALTGAQRAEMEKIIAPAVNDWKTSMAKQGLDGEGLYERARQLVRQFQTVAR